MEQILYAVMIPIGLGWVTWVSRGIIKINGMPDRLVRVEEKLDRLIERFL